jgi:hypothetical protein
VPLCSADWRRPHSRGFPTFRRRPPTAERCHENAGSLCDAKALDAIPKSTARFPANKGRRRQSTGSELRTMVIGTSVPYNVRRQE